MARTSIVPPFTCLLWLSSLPSAGVAATPITAVRIASGLEFPTWIGSAPGDATRLFVLEKMGRVRIIGPTLVGTPFLDIAAKVTDGGERGLLGLAFHPNYESNGYFYVNYTRFDFATVVERYQVSSNPEVADPASATLIFGPVAQPFSNHNGGCIAFGSDGFLYVALGDGGSGGDPFCFAQDGSVLLGKLARIDVDQGGAAPPSNPFVGDPAFLDPIWSYGLRNPWRFSFDRANGDLYIGDVGQGSREEIDWLPGGNPGGANFGWNVMEGDACFGSTCGGVPPCDSPLFVDPVLDYTHSEGCSVTGGYVYRGCAIPDLDGVYFYGDYCNGRVWSFRIQNGTVVQHQERTAEIDPAGPDSIGSISTFGEDACGELYIADFLDGEIFRIVPNVPAPGVDLGFGKTGGNGLVPILAVCGLLDSGNTADVTLTEAPPGAFALVFASLNQNPVATLGGTLVPDLGSAAVFPLATDSGGSWKIVASGGGGVLDVYAQTLIDDPGASAGVGFSNALRLTFLP